MASFSAVASDEGKIANDEDNIFGGHGDDPGFLVALTGSAMDGFAGTIKVGVDPTATAAEGGMDGGAGGGPPGSPGSSPPPGGPPRWPMRHATVWWVTRGARRFSDALRTVSGPSQVSAIG